MDADNLDCVPLIKRRRLLLSAAAKPSVLQGLPKGVRFDPSDEELLWHLLAKVGKGEAEPHFLISEFITSLDEGDGFDLIHPQKLPGVKQDGTMSYFFHRPHKRFNCGSKKHQKAHTDDFGNARWHKIGKTIPVVIDGIHQGCKEIMVLYTSMKKGEKPEKTNWVMHQYHLGSGEDEGGFFASKIFYERKSKQSDKNTQDLPLDSVEAIAAQREVVTIGPESHLENKHLDSNSVKASDQDVSSLLSAKFGDLRNDCVTGEAQDRRHLVGTQFETGRCNADNVPEAATGKVRNSSLIDSPDSVIAGAQHGNMIANFQLYSSPFSTFTDHLKDEPLEDGNANGLSFNNSIFKSRKSLDSEVSIHKCLNESNISVAMSNLGNQNDNSTLFDSVISTCPIVVKAEPSEDNCMRNIPNVTDEDCQCIDNQVFNSVMPTFPVKVMVEPLEGSYTRNKPQNITVKFSSSSLYGHITANSPIVTEFKASNYPDDLPSGGKIHEENVLTKDEHLNSNNAELMSPKELGATSRLSSENSEKACSSQDNTTFTGFGNEAGNVCYRQASFLEEVHIDAIDSFQNSSLSKSQLKVKLEPLESCSLKPSLDPRPGFQDSSTLGAEIKTKFFGELSTDMIEHIPLKKRIEMQLSRNDSNSDNDKNLKCSQRITLQSSKGGSVCSSNKDASRISLRRKGKKTATDSVETALQEDAPGLLQVLLDKGIIVEEIKLYGAMEDDEPLEISSIDDNFEDLQTVITKLFSESPSLLKFPLLRHINGSGAFYCLTCLISLIEQTRYLRFRDRPVEWGWCRDLQSFIFVFKMHNRIVLERPVYGYATYFFELLDSLPVEWQIKRLVTTMKLTCSGRSTLIENRPLLVGEDLTEGEARVLEHYGWKRKSGLGTLLNYCDRVYHDTKNERDASEWKAKIGKLLMDGHDAGSTVVDSLPKKAESYMRSRNAALKLEI